MAQMTNNRGNVPTMPNPKLIAIAIFDGCQILDATGPAQVFATANVLDKRAHYDVRLVASKPGLVTTNGGIRVIAEALPAKTHTALIAGGDEPAILAAARDRALLKWIAAQTKPAKRVGSVCSGAFLLAAAGLLNGKRVATHWSAADTLSKMFPDIAVDKDAIYIQDGKIWTSAGVTTGIDMALALVAEDHGHPLAAQVARQLVVYMHRPGHQSQFSAPLELQSSGDARLERLASWIESRLHEDLDAGMLAERAGMSLRNFHRHMKLTLNTTPKRWIEDLRLTRARALLESTAKDLASIASASGFTGPDHFIKAFDRRIGLTPGAYRRIHSVHNGAAPLERQAAAQ
jgi:transcriptional regulator GlxA family with amidase domain